MTRLAPSGRSLIVGFALIVAAAGLYVGARMTSVFAVRTVEVRGAGPADTARIRHALAPLVGKSLLAVGDDDVELRVLSLPEVARVSYGRAYPHTLRVIVVPELPTVVVRRGADSWLVSGRGRVLRKIPRGSAARLPRVWVPQDSQLARGAMADSAAGAEAAHTMAVLRAAGFRVPVRTVRTGEAGLILELRSGVELRLGEPPELRLKLAVARRALPFVGSGSYLDVSVPQRPVSGSTLNSKVEP
ncbi:MAG: FtsQ-type POTRA domain-containing protein [Thermoleophilia bacterium]